MSYKHNMPDLTLIREFKRRAEEALLGRVVRVMLYGSRARGDARPDSDWDVAVFIAGDPTLEDQRTLSNIGFGLMLDMASMSRLWLSMRREARSSPYFLSNVLRDGLAA